jgi:hypothetical protein
MAPGPFLDQPSPISADDDHHCWSRPGGHIAPTKPHCSLDMSRSLKVVEGIFRLSSLPPLSLALPSILCFLISPCLFCVSSLFGNFIASFHVLDFSPSTHSLTPSLPALIQSAGLTPMLTLSSPCLWSDHAAVLTTTPLPNLQLSEYLLLSTPFPLLPARTKATPAPRQMARQRR